MEEKEGGGGAQKGNLLSNLILDYTRCICAHFPIHVLSHSLAILVTLTHTLKPLAYDASPSSLPIVGVPERTKLSRTRHTAG